MIDFQLLALDLDETLLTKGKAITEENKYWIEQAEKAGVTVIFATGRGLKRVEEYRKELDLHTPMVLTNGAEIWKKPGELLKRYYIKQEELKKIHQLAKETRASYWGYNNESLVGHKNWTDNMYKLNWLKFGIRHQDEQMINYLRTEISKIPGVTMTSSAPDNIEVSAAGVSKRTGVQAICDYLQLSLQDVMAIGDNFNDYELIKAAGLGVAMNNGEEELKKVADKQTKSNEENGVAYAIQHYLLR